jgi:hypothetical protein
VAALAATCAAAGYGLEERLPIYPAFAARSEFLDPGLRPLVERLAAARRPVAPLEAIA